MQAWGLSNAGKVRQQNQDYYEIVTLDKDVFLAVVCDGMGGARSGNVASKLAAEVFVESVRQGYREAMTTAEMRQIMTEAIQEANFAVYDQAQQFEHFSGMGTTLVAALIVNSIAVIVNVGDSRAYYLSDEGVQCLTVDHSLVQVMVQNGELSKEEAKHYPGKNFITRAIGTESMVECDIFEQHVQENENLLLCTDGLSNLLADQEILFEVLHGVDKSDCCRRLFEIAMNRGAPDNITAVLVAI